MKPLYVLIFSVLTCQLSANNPEVEYEYLRRLLRENKSDSILAYVDSWLGRAGQAGRAEAVYCYSMKSAALLQTGKFNESLLLTRRAISDLPAVQDSAILSEIWKYTSHTYNRNGKLDSALLYTRLLYGYAQRAHDDKMIYASLAMMGNIHLQNKQYQQSLEFFRDALNISLRNNIKSNLPGDYYNIGLAQYTNKMYDEAITSYKESVRTGLQQNNLRLVARAYGSLADIMDTQNRLDEQLKYLQKANELATRLQDKRLLAMGCSNLVHHHIKKGNYQKAIEYGNQAITYLKEQPLIQLEIDIDSLMYVSYKTLGQSDKAFEYFEAYSAKNNRLRNEQVTLRLNELTSSYEIEKKKSELAVAERAGRINILIIFILSLLLIFLLFFRIREGFYKRILFKKEKEADLQLTMFRNILKAPVNPVAAMEDESGAASESAASEEFISPEKSNQIFLQIMEIVDQEKLFLSPELDQKYIMKRLNTNKRYIYESIRVHGDQNFKGLVNRLRINEAKHIIQERLRNKEAVNLPEVYLSSGFNSRTSFYRTFKSITGLPPGDYVDQLEKELRG